MTKTVVYCNIDLVTGQGTITIKISDNGIDTYETKDITVDPQDRTSITDILNGYID